MTIDAVIDDLIECLNSSIVREVPRVYPSPDDCLATFGDEIVWGPEPDRVAAVILPRPGGIKVVRLDREIPEDPERGPTNVVAREVPRPEPPGMVLTEDESMVLDLAREMGIKEADFLLRIGGDLGREIVPGDRNSRTTEAIGRLLLPEDRFIWRRGAGFTTTDDEAVALMDRLRAEYPGCPVAEVLTHEERRLLTNIRVFGLAETQGVIHAVVALGLSIDEALGRLAVPTKGPSTADTPSSAVADDQADEESERWTREDSRLREGYRRKPRSPFVVAQEDSLLYFSDRRYDSLGDVVAQEVKDGGSDEDADRAIWRDNRCLAVVRLNKGREPEVIRLDRPRS